ncbi:MarR family winged helix-turn-helix transcriptional regulator [Alkaliphilus serpentinus]|uniref:MarR family transcriptional regulator n=1 Tax=Alkaliphilus serpentinus TaxID=1482731 RepID=A0A833M712_9FIRM|nr:MarR family transcriptional regulator [Alkaliphilus serpentinus]KAB3526216.1 MarR family transcriptional regulator [Alkaliphilus serpentinus]
MDRKKFESVVDSLFLFLPLLKKKLVTMDLYDEEQDLFQSHFQILFLLDDMGTLTASALAKNLNISKPNVTPLVLKLTKKGLIERIGSEKDKRYAHLKLTEKGMDFMNQHKTLVINDLKKKLSNFTDDELENLAAALDVIKGIISKFE